MKNLYSPSMLKSYLSCKYTIFNEVNEKKLSLKKKEITVSDAIRLEQGNVHEEDYFKILQDKYSKVIDIKNLDITRDEKFKKTVECMEEGYEVIRGGYLKYEEWIGEFDFLEINKNLKSKFGDYSYEVIDTKNTSRVKVDHVIQVGMYTYLLEQIQEVLPKNFYIVLKTLEKERVPVSQVYEFFKYNKSKYEHFIKEDLEKTEPEKCQFCNVCPWIEECENIWIKNRHLNQVGGNNKNNIKKLKDAGIKTIDDLAALSSKKKIDNLREETKAKLIKQANLQLEYEKTGKPKFEVIEENITLIKGFNLLPKPSKCDLFFDLESVPDYVVPGKLEYLFGIYYIEEGKEKFEAFWAHSKEQEKQSVIKFFDFTKKHFQKYPDSKIYHYASYEITALEKLTSFHKVHGADYDHYLHLGKFVDLFRVTKQAILVSENSYSIKNLEKFYNFSRTGDVQKGDVSEHFYVEWMETKDQKLLDEIESYNKQDCHSTYELREWLLSIKPKNTGWFTPEKEVMEYRDNELKMMDYQRKIEQSKIKDPNLKQIVSDIIGFYNRENKPDWREFFDRKDFSDEELVEDIACLGNMKRIDEITQEKQSYVYTYQFEEQEFKLKDGQRVTIANNASPDQSDSAGTIINIDHDSKILKIKRGIKQGYLPDTLSIGPSTPYDASKLELTTYKFIDSLLEEEDKYHALKDILLKKIPKIKGLKSGDKIIKTDNFLEELPKIIFNLENSYLYIQGPPGTGKTTQAANAILELIKKGKKIAITANSHKVVHNLIERVERLAKKNKVSFRGLKAGRMGDLETIYDGDFVKTSSKDPDFIQGLKSKNTLLYGGTKYHFSNGYYDSSIDYLFVDEAGQLSLADLVVLGTIAKNIILIGDQLQLGQPTRGTHPGEAGSSILDFLLGDADTISEDRGVFLNKTFRLHPIINEFISENFYEGRLIADEKTSKRKISFNDKCTIQSEGIHYLPMNHKDNIQTSIEECEMVKNLVNQLVGLNYFDGEKDRKITIEDILIISPYNAQVNALKFHLANKEAKVGTIDKFQGQEAPITIISMASSDSETLPRNKEFFFNRNRLNVAISRSQCVSILLFNPLLLETSPSTYDQIKLLNNFYKLLKFS